MHKALPRQRYTHPMPKSKVRPYHPEQLQKILTLQWSTVRLGVKLLPQMQTPLCTEKDVSESIEKPMHDESSSNVPASGTIASETAKPDLLAWKKSCRFLALNFSFQDPPSLLVVADDEPRSCVVGEDIDPFRKGLTRRFFPIEGDLFFASGLGFVHA